MFDASYFRKRKYLAWRAPIIASAIKRTFNPSSVIDFGCSIGEIVRSLNELGVPSIGVDSAEAVFEHSHPETPILQLDITKPLPTKSKFDLALCFEVLRFLNIEQVAALIENFKKHSRRVLIGYGGEFKPLVVEAMWKNGYEFYEPAMTNLRQHLEKWKDKPAIKAIYHGGMYFNYVNKK